MSTLTAWLLAQ